MKPQYMIISHPGHISKPYLIFFTGLLLNLLSASIACSQQYHIDLIQPGLLEDAKAVVRISDEMLEYDRYGNIRHEKTFAITILDKGSETEGYFYLVYDKYINVIDLECRLFDAAGKQTKLFTIKDFKDVGAVSGYSLYEDNRIRYLMPAKPSYPYTVQYKSVVYYRGTFNFPDWDPVPDYYCSVESSKYTLKTVPGQKIIYRSFKPEQSNFSTSKGKTTDYTWELKNFTALEPEPFSPPSNEIFPGARCAFEEFTYAGTSGSMASWQDFGKWIYSLNNGRDVLPSEAVVKVQGLVASCTTDLEKVKILYKYLQETTRYVSIQIGLGGFQPMDAASVYLNGYGDCKALSNYMMAILKVAGIKSYYTIIGAGASAKPLIEDLPVPQFNHVILCVPIANDTVWLECTNQSAPFGYQNDFTANRKALLISKDGGTLVSTKHYSALDNSIQSKIKVELRPESDKVYSEIETQYAGIQLDYLLDLLVLGEDEKRKTILSETPLDIFELRSFQISFDDNLALNSGKLSLKVELPGYLSKSGLRYFLPCDPLKREVPLPRKLSERKNDIHIRYSRSEIDTILFNLPRDMEVEFLPEEVSLEQDWGSYFSESRIEGNLLIFTRKFTIHQGRYSAACYKDFYTFFSTINKADNSKVLLKKREILQ